MRAQILNFSRWVDETDPKELQDYFGELLTRSGFHIENLVVKHFEPHGFTALYLLSESHFAIHTFPEESTTYIELSSCVVEPFNAFCRNIRY